MLLIDKLLWYGFFLIAMGKMLVHDTTPYTGRSNPKHVYLKKLVLESVFLILSCFLLALISERSEFLFRLICAAVTTYHYHILIGLGCRNRTRSRYANLLTLILVIFAADDLFLLGGILILRLVFLRNALHREYLSAAEKRNCAPAACAVTAEVYTQPATEQPQHAAYCYNEAEEAEEDEARWQAEERDWNGWMEEEEDEDWNSWMDQEEPVSLDEEDDYYSSEDDSWGYADDPCTLDYAGTDWNSYDYSNNPEVAVSILDMLY